MIAQKKICRVSEQARKFADFRKSQNKEIKKVKKTFSFSKVFMFLTVCSMLFAVGVTDTKANNPKTELFQLNNLLNFPVTNNSKISPELVQSYSFVGTVNNVDAYWRVLLPQYSKTYEVLYKFVNRNSRKVEVKYEASFRCGMFDTGKDDEGLFDLAANGTQSGELSGLYTYPCEEGVKPASINLHMRIQ